ncbi:MAG: hypothetical protein H6621_07585 [Halobacteriovoraceae bacterium]|nr:hypothetical protein [Halobacteriovoraceae bacterium]
MKSLFLLGFLFATAAQAKIVKFEYDLGIYSEACVQNIAKQLENDQDLADYLEEGADQGLYIENDDGEVYITVYLDTENSLAGYFTATHADVDDTTSSQCELGERLSWDVAY